MNLMAGVSTLALAGTLLLGAGAATAENNPVDENWWPSEFGADDQAGATGYITPEKRVEAAKLVTQGKVATLGMPYHLRTPVFPGRLYSITIPGGGNPTHDLAWAGDNYRQTFMDELVTAQIGQVGTQFDSLAHPMIQIKGKQDQDWEDGNYFYNGNRLEDIGGPYGMKKNGTENVGSFFTPGHPDRHGGLEGREPADRLSDQHGGLHCRTRSAGNRGRGSG